MAEEGRRPMDGGLRGICEERWNRKVARCDSHCIGGFGGRWLVRIVAYFRERTFLYIPKTANYTSLSRHFVLVQATVVKYMYKSKLDCMSYVLIFLRLLYQAIPFCLSTPISHPNLSLILSSLHGSSYPAPNTLFSLPATLAVVPSPLDL